MMLSEGQMSDYKGAALMIDALPKARAMLGDRGYDADWFREALATRGSPRASRQKPIVRCRSLTIATSIASVTGRGLSVKAWSHD